LFCATGATGSFNQEIARFQSPNIVFEWNGPYRSSNIIRFKPFGAALNVGPNPLVMTPFRIPRSFPSTNNVSSLMNAAGAGGMC